MSQKKKRRRGAKQKPAARPEPAKGSKGKAAMAILAAVAAAVGIAGGVVALWPKPDPKDVAKFGDISVLPGVALTDFHPITSQGAGKDAHAGSVRLVAMVTVSPAPNSGTATPTESAT